MGEHGRLKRLAKELMERLKNIPDKIEVETGVELIPVTRLFVKVRIINLAMKKQREICHEKNRKKDPKCVYNHTKSTCKRDET